MIGFFILMFASCEHKELCYDHSHLVRVQILFDWENAPDAHPTSMRLYLFPTDGREVLLYEFTNSHAGHISVPAGCYKALCLNSDTESILYRNINRFTTFEAYATDGTLEVRSSSAPRADGTQQERIAKSTDRLWSACMENVNINIQDQNKILIFYPEQSVCHYQLKIKNVANLKYVPSEGISGSLSSMAGGLLPGMKKTTTELVTIPFKVVHKDSTTLMADFLCFGHCPSDKKIHKLVIYAILADGNKYYYTYDVTPQVHNAPDFRNVKIELDSFHLPKPIVNGGGFQPAVEGWKNVDVNISM